MIASTPSRFATCRHYLTVPGMASPSASIVRSRYPLLGPEHSPFSSCNPFIIILAPGSPTERKDKNQPVLIFINPFIPESIPASGPVRGCIRLMHILLVDDEIRLFLDLIRRFLLRGREEMQIDTCRSCQEAIGFLKASRFDAIVLDYDSSGMSGSIF